MIRIVLIAISTLLLAACASAPPTRVVYRAPTKKVVVVKTGPARVENKTPQTDANKVVAKAPQQAQAQ